MNKRVALLFALLTVSVASAATLKMKWFDWPTDPGTMDGVATLHYAPGQGTKIHVTITGFEANTTYHIVVADAAFDPYVTTNNGGNAEVNGSNPADLTIVDQPIEIYEVHEDETGRVEVLVARGLAQ